MIASLLQNTLLAASLFSSAIAAGDHALTASRALGAAEFSCPTTDEEGRGLRARYVPPPKGKGKGKGDYYKKGKKDKSKDDDDGKKGKKQKKQPKCLTIGELFESSEDFTTLVETLKFVEFWEAVNDPEVELTIFAPTNDAFAGAPEGTIGLNTLSRVLSYHTVDYKVTSSDLFGAGASTITIPTAFDDNTFDVVIKGHDIFIQGDANDVEDLPQVIAADLYACNGVVHVVDQVILPKLVLPTILELCQDCSNTMVSLLELTELDAAVDDPDASLTLFVPIEDAFGQLDPEFVFYLVNNIDVLSLILKFHIVGKFLAAEDLVAHPPPTVETLAEQEISPEFDGTDLFLSGFNNDPANLPILVGADYLASNGTFYRQGIGPQVARGWNSRAQGTQLVQYRLGRGWVDRDL